MLISVDEVHFLFLIFLSIVVAMTTHFVLSDALTYHLPLAIEFSRGKFSFGSTFQDERFFFPANWSLIQAPFLKLQGDLRFVHVPAVLMLLGVIAISRRLFRHQAMTIGLGVVAAVILGSPLHRADLFLAADFLLATFLALSWLGACAYLRSRRFRDLALMSLGAGLAAGTKPMGAFYGAVSFALIFGHFFFDPSVEPPSRFFKKLLGAGLVALSLASPWYVRNWVSTGGGLGGASSYLSMEVLKTSLLYQFFTVADKKELLLSCASSVVTQFGGLGLGLLCLGFAATLRRWIKEQDNGPELFLVLSFLGLFTLQPYGGVEELDRYHVHLRYGAWLFLYLQLRGMAAVKEWQYLLALVLGALFTYQAQWFLRFYGWRYWVSVAALIAFSLGIYSLMLKGVRARLRPSALWMTGLSALAFAFFCFLPGRHSAKVEQMWERYYKEDRPIGYGIHLKVLDEHPQIRRVAFINRRYKLPLYGKGNERSVVYEVSASYQEDKTFQREDWTRRLQDYGVDAVLVTRVENFKTWDRPVDYKTVYSLLKQNRWKVLWEDANGCIFISPALELSRP